MNGKPYIIAALLFITVATAATVQSVFPSPYGRGNSAAAESVAPPSTASTSSSEPVPEVPDAGEDEIEETEHHDTEQESETEVPIAKSAGGLVRLSHLSAEWMPNLAARATKVVAEDGSWSETARRLSIVSGDVVRIPKGTDVVYDAADSPPLEAIVVEGTLRFDPDQPTRLRTGTLLVSGGRLIIRPEGANSAELSIYGSIDSDSDPANVLVGLIATGGEVDIQGRRDGEVFVRASGKKGSKTLVLDRASGWRAGDEIFIAATSAAGKDPTYWWYNARDFSRRMPFPEEWEAVRVASIDGMSVTLDRALAHDHQSAYAALLDRSVTIRTEPSSPSRGHIMFAGNTKVSVSNALIKDMGRTTVNPLGDAAFSDDGTVLQTATNQQGRYVLHAHHLVPEFLFEGNVIYGSVTTRFGGERGIAGSPRWGIVNHDSHGAIRGNVVIGAAGSGIVGEDGTETGVVEGNLVIGTGGGSGDGDDERFGSTRGEDMAHGGFGYWFRGPFLEVTDNKAAGHFNQTAYLYFVHPSFIRNSIPDRPWIPADLRGKSQTDLVSRNPIRAFSDNSASAFFGNAGFMILYSNVPNVISGLDIEMLGGEDVRGIFTRHSEALTVSDSSLRGPGSGAATLASESSPIKLEDVSVTGFDN